MEFLSIVKQLFLLLCDVKPKKTADVFVMPPVVSRDMTSEKRAQKFLSELAPQTSCRGENSGCVAKCRPFPQAMWCKALGILKGMCDLLTPFTQKLTERLQVSFLSMIPSLHELVWLAINQIRQSAKIYLWTEHGTTGCRCFYLRNDCVTSWKCQKKCVSTKVLTTACFSE